MSDEAHKARTSATTNGVEQPPEELAGRGGLPPDTRSAPKLAWSRPTVRVMVIERTETGGDIWEKEAAGGWYHPDS